MVASVKKDYSVFYRSPHNYDVHAASLEASVVPVGESLTVQSMSEDADINVLMHRFGVAAKLPQGVKVPEYGDFEGISDFATALEAVKSTAEQFMLIPAPIRARFDNDPQKFLMYVADPVNDEQLRKDGFKLPYTEEQIAARKLAAENSVDGRIAQLQAKLDAALAKPA